MSTADYYLDVYDAAGDLQFVVTDFTALSYLRAVNAPGIMTFGVRGDHPLTAMIGDRWQVEVWRKPEGGVFARDFVGLYRMGEWYHGEGGSTAVLTCPGLMSLLAQRIVAYPANTVNRSAFTAEKAETLMKTLVTYNATSAAATADGRLRAGAVSGLSVAADGAGGAALDWYCAYENLLETVQKIALIGGGDFDLVKTSATTWQFRWYTGQLGSDKTASVIFALERGNMANPQYKEIRIDEKTSAIVGGKGEDDGRATAIRSGPNYSAGNDIEMFVGASDVDTIDGLEARGDAALQERRAVQQFGFGVVQTPATTYGTHYGLGDLVSAVNPFSGATLTMKIYEAALSIDEDGRETVDIRMVVR